MASDPAELVHPGKRFDHREVAHGDMARQRRSIAHDYAAADLGIVRDMDVGHQQVVISDAGHQTAAFRAAMYGDEFADLVTAADASLRHLAFHHGQFHSKLVTGDNLPAELRVFDRDQQHELALAILDALEHQHARGLRHRFDDQDTRHYGEIGKVAIEERLIRGDVFDS